MLPAIRVALRVAAKVVIALAVTTVFLFALGWVVDAVVDPAEQEITTVEE
jgi:hypothetical protein